MKPTRLVPLPPNAATGPVEYLDVEHELVECRGCYLRRPEGTGGVPPRPQFEEEEPFANVNAAVRGE
jgi:hypothetical protein